MKQNKMMKSNTNPFTIPNKIWFKCANKIFATLF